MPSSKWYDYLTTMGKDLRISSLFQRSRTSSRVFTALITLLIIAGFSRDSVARTLSPVTFDEFLNKRFSNGSTDWDRERFCPVSTSFVARRVLEAYGSIFAAGESVSVPAVCIFRGEFEANKYQKGLQQARIEVSGIPVDLQPAAAEALGRTISEAAGQGLRISPYDGTIAGSRTYGQTLMLWNSRFFPALDYWIEQGRLTAADREEIFSLDLEKKMEKIMDWESRGIYFSTNRTRSILTSTAPPGSSQHLTFLALDVAEYADPDVRRILNQNGWYQTVIDDPPHFTYLGLSESQLPSRGLRAVYKGNYLYWVPNMSTPNMVKSTN
jgi:hypothetical protein